MILIVDDDLSVTASLALLLKQSGLTSTAAGSPEEALEVLRRQPCQLIIQDMNFSRRTSGDEGLALLRQIRDLTPSIPVILITAWGSIALAVEGMKAGASDFVTKPWTNQQMLQTVQTALGLVASRAQADDRVLTRDELDGRYDFGDLVGRDGRLLRILQLIGRVAPTDASVLITGESGTGKELIAEAIHRNSRRAGKPFVKVNLGGVPADAVRERDVRPRARRLHRCARRSQGPLRDRQRRDDLPRRDRRPRSAVAGQNAAGAAGPHLRGAGIEPAPPGRCAGRDRHQPRPTELVARGEFREDLLYRINLMAIHLPPLRERPDDIPILASRFLQTAGEVYRRDPLTLSAAANSWLQAQPWPGNVRQLRQWVERAVLVSTRDRLEVEDFAESMEPAPHDAVTAALPPVGSMTMDEIERAMIVKSLRHHGGNISKVADSLGLSRAALYRRFVKYQIAV